MPDPSGAPSSESLTHLVSQIGLAAASGADPNAALAQLNIYPNLAAVKTAQIAAGAASIMVLSYANPGDCPPVTYARGGTPGMPGVVVDGSSNPWTLVSGADGVSAKAFGQTALAGTSQNTWVTTGPDDTAAIQAAIDFEVYGHGAPPFLGQGVSLTSDTLQLGYGGRSSTAHLSGLGAAFVTNGGFAGSGIGVNFSDRPVINVQTGRGTSISNLALQGPLTAWVTSNNLGVAGAVLDDTNPASWLCPSLSPNQNSRYTPAACVTVDAYSGPAPSPAYPPVNIPAWIGNKGQYNKGPSSRTLLHEVLISGFNTGVCITPGNYSGNGDFTEWDHGWIDQCMWGISVGQTQSRSVGADYMQFASVFCCLTNNTQGQQLGELGSQFKNWTLGGVIKLFHLGAPGEMGSITWDTLYFEAFYKFGEIANGGVANNTITLNSPFGTFDLQVPTRGIPASMLNFIGNPSAAVGGTQPFIINGGNLVAYYSVLTLMVSGVLLKGYVSIYPVSSQQPSIPSYACLAHNALAGGLVVPNLVTTGVPHEINFPVRDVDLQATSGAQLLGPYYQAGSRNHCIPLYAVTVAPRLAGPQDAIVNPQVSRVTSIGAPAVSTYSNSTGVLTYTDTRSQDQIETYGGAPGDVILEVMSNTVAFISDITYSTSAAVTAQGQNNLYTGKLACAEVVPWPSGVKTMLILNSRLYTPPLPVTCSAANGANILTNVTNLAAGGANEQVQVGDRVWFDANTNPLGLTPTSCKITGVNAAAGTITLAGKIATAGGASLTLQRLGLFIRQPPPNA